MSIAPANRSCKVCHGHRSEGNPASCFRRWKGSLKDVHVCRNCAQVVDNWNAKCDEHGVRKG